MGWQVDPDDPTQIKRDTVSALRPEAEENQVASPEMTSKMYMHGNIASVDPKLQTADGVVTTVPIYDNLGYAYTVKFKITESNAGSGTYDLAIESIKDSNNVDILQNGYTASLQDATIKFDPDSGKFYGLGGARWDNQAYDYVYGYHKIWRSVQGSFFCKPVRLDRFDRIGLLKSDNVFHKGWRMCS